MAWIEKEGKTVDEARAAAMAALGLPVEEAEVEVLREGARGLFGLGGEAALVRVRARSEAVDVRSAFHDGLPSVSLRETVAIDDPAVVDVAPAPVAVVEQDDRVVAEEEEETAGEAGERQQLASGVAVEMVRGILDRMGLVGEVRTRVDGGTVYVEVFGDEMGILIGRGGKTLEALQELVRAGVQRRLKSRAAVVVDVESYWERRRETGRSRPRGPQRSPNGR